MATHDLNAPRQMNSRTTSRGLIALVVSMLVLVLAMLMAVGNGTLEISPATTLTAVMHGLLGRPLEGLERIVWELRLPRVSMAVLVGAALAISGAAMQGLFRNPLADPYLLGVASGASFGATVAILGLGGRVFTAAGLMSNNVSSLTPVFAFLGAFGAVMATLALSRVGGRSRNDALILAGVVVGSLLVSLSSYLILSDGTRMRAVLAWTLGNLSLVGWSEVLKVLPYALLGAVALIILARALDALQLGEDTARTLGVRLERVQLAVVVAASLSTAAAVSFVGVIGFVGLIAPHVMRRLVGPGHRLLLPASALAGAILLVLADLGARVLHRPEELPVGILTTLIGGSFFLWLLRRRA